MKRLAIALLIALSAAALLAQEASESIEVRVVNVDVVVRDRAGKPVTGLTKADFEIYENGQKREVTNLYEVRSKSLPAQATTVTQASPSSVPAEPPVEIRPRNIVMFVDNYSLNPFRRDKVLQSLRKFVDEQLRPQDRVMLAISAQEVEVVTPFTSDRNAIRDGVESVKKIASGGFNRTSSVELIKRRINEYIDAHKDNPGKFDWKDYYSMSVSLVDGYVEEEILRSRKALAALGRVTTALVGLEGKNVVIYAGAHLPERPGAELYQWLYNAFSPYMPSLSPTTETISGKSGSRRS